MDILQVMPTSRSEYPHQRELPPPHTVKETAAVRFFLYALTPVKYN